MTRVFNFSPGPATMPLPALEQAAKDLIDFEGTGIGIAEHSHRGPAYGKVHEEVKALVRELLGVPDGYHVLFMQGGARGQFGLIPMNLLPKGASADYIMTGTWSEKAIKEAQIVASAREVGNTKKDGAYTRVPSADELELDPNAAYVHITSNNTIYGTQFFEFPDTGDVPLIADMSSDIAWAPIDVSKFGMIYAGAQKNMGPAGITLVIIRDDLVQKSEAAEGVPAIFRYKTIADGDSLQNTIPTFPVYMVRNVLRWVKEQGGVAAMEKHNREKAALVYDVVDANPDFYRCPVEKASRSVMNLVFRLPTEELEKKLIATAAEQGLVNVKGHRSVGGLRVSAYNAMPREGMERMAALMTEFAETHG